MTLVMFDARALSTFPESVQRYIATFAETRFVFGRQVFMVQMMNHWTAWERHPRGVGPGHSVDVSEYSISPDESLHDWLAANEGSVVQRFHVRDNR